MDLMLMVFIISLLILITGGVFKAMENIFLTEPLIAVCAGILLGPDVLNWLTTRGPAEEFSVLKTTCEFTIAMALMATALRLPDRFFRNHYKTQSTLVVAGMILMWLCSSGLLYWVLEGFSIGECLLLGAIVTPTDPVVASTIVTGEKANKFLPASVRNTLSFESGVNDGLAYPIVFLCIFLITTTEFPTEEWILTIVLYESVLSVIIALVVGYAAGKFMHAANKAGLMNKKSLLPFSLALGFLLLAGLNVLKMNGIIGVFAGGLGFALSINQNEDLQEERVQESMERIFTIPVFFILGMMLPWNEWYEMGWTSIWIILAILLLRRVPAFFAVAPLLPQFKDRKKQAMIMGWFGPIGVAALYYAIHSMEKTGFDEAWIIPSLVVFSSTVVHGITSVPFQKLFYRSSTKEK